MLSSVAKRAQSLTLGLWRASFASGSQPDLCGDSSIGGRLVLRCSAGEPRGADEEQASWRYLGYLWQRIGYSGYEAMKWIESPMDHHFQPLLSRLASS